VVKLPSRLRQTTLGDVLGALYRERVTGALELIEANGATAGRLHRVHLCNGLVYDVETTGSGPRLGEVLRREGLVEPRVLPMLDRVPVFAGSKRYGQWLVEARLLTPRALRQALERQRRERLENLYDLDDAKIFFRVARTRPPTLGTIPLVPPDFLHNRPRAREHGLASPTRMDPVRDRALRTLGLTEHATHREVQEAFRRLASAAHPDRFPGVLPERKVELEQRFSEISAAYHVLVA
jgi:DnaJ-domain-containing protein 1